MLTLVKTVVKKGDKKYTNFYLQLENGNLIAIDVKRIKGYEDLAKKDFVKLDTIAVNYNPNKKA